MPQRTSNCRIDVDGEVVNNELATNCAAISFLAEPSPLRVKIDADLADKKMKQQSKGPRCNELPLIARLNAECSFLSDH